MIPKNCKRLAEVDFPIAEVSRQAVREKSIRHGHPSTLHLWWARRPLASSRAMLMALLLPNPCDAHCPTAFKQQAREILREVRQPPANDAELRKAKEQMVRILDEWELGGRQGLCPVPDEPVDEWHHDVNRLPMYEMKRWCDAFTARQKLGLWALGKTLRDVPRSHISRIQTLNAISLDRTADYNSANCRWVPHGEFIGNTFTRQALPMVWDFAEVNPMADSTGSFRSAIDWVANVIEA